MLRYRWLWIMVVLLPLAMPKSAFAYVGPGAGITAIGAALAFVAATAFAILGFIWYPLKRLTRALSRKRGGDLD